MKTRLSLGLILLCAVLAAGCASMRSKCHWHKQPTATGTWKYSVTMPNGQTRENTMRLTQDGDKLTGVMLGRQGRETPIQDGTIKDDKLSFTVTRERRGQTFTTKTEGELIGDTIKGRTTMERDGQTRTIDWEAKREPAAEAAK